MNKKRIYIEVLLHKGIYKEENTGRQLYEMSEQELWNLLKGDGENGQKRSKLVCRAHGK
ncbi:Fur-regulated basic protein FbpA [Bacillus wiedmannii]|uniref:Fur-regulated basic protein FbpA n=1 Tax=Bacillus wiedmannii TaxID=1890302 RepID=UPI0032F7B0BF|nr:Fur-regulated basic protein FbpA [Bacillus cereus]